jgi:single-strand DNA-binding protein
MSRGVNKVFLIGNLGNDPETRYTQGGMAITTISLATSSVRKDKDGNQVERTEWHRVKFFGKLAEIADEYLKKGAKVCVIGSIRYDKFTGDDGVEKYFTDIIADEMNMLGDAGGGHREERPQREERAPSRGHAPTRSNTPPPRGNAPSSDEPFPDDDIPF